MNEVNIDSAKRVSKVFISKRCITVIVPNINRERALGILALRMREFAIRIYNKVRLDIVFIKPVGLETCTNSLVRQRLPVMLEKVVDSFAWKLKYRGFACFSSRVNCIGLAKSKVVNQNLLLWSVVH